MARDREYQQRRYWERAFAGVCVRCGSEEIFTEVLCLDCASKTPRTPAKRLDSMGYDEEGRSKLGSLRPIEEVDGGGSQGL